ncbi:Hypothetical protein A7982_00194 [Minicystis rosea]|nr:Hypothetical protein A7982_00194 [Minicystis rosea]
MALELSSLGTLTLVMGESISIPNCPAGMRVIVEFPAVTWEGPRLRGRLKGHAAADWIAIGPRAPPRSTFASPSRPTTAR